MTATYVSPRAVQFLVPSSEARRNKEGRTTRESTQLTQFSKVLTTETTAKTSTTLVTPNVLQTFDKTGVNTKRGTPNASTQFNKADGNTSLLTTIRPTKQSISKPFIYLIQTEHCLPSQLNSSKEIGYENTCKCDVVVLSYRTPCLEPKPSHVSYVFVGEGSWNLGRNILYFIARERTPGYNYYIFLDDDIELRFNSFTPQEMKKLTPFRAFEEWLLDYQPAVGIADELGSQGAVSILKKRSLNCGINEASMVIPTAYFDALFNAFHRNAIEHILPYPTKYDKESWWASQLHVICSVELKFRGQALMFVPVTVNNPQHRGYPRTAQNFNAQARAFVEEIQSKAPAVYQNRTLFNKLRNSLFSEYTTLQAATYCMNVTRRYPIVPYSHFESNSS